MKILLSLALLFISLSFTLNESSNDDLILQNPTVYVCRNQSVKVFHTDRNCPGLKRCSGQIETAKAQEVKNKGFKHCQLPACSNR